MKPMVNSTGMRSVKSMFILSIAAAMIYGCGSSSAGSAGGGATPAKVTALKIEDLKKGDGGEFGLKAPVKKGDDVFVLYTGKLADGKVFDSNETEGKDAFNFTVGNSEVIKGWDQGLPGMVVGGERKLSIPSGLGYGTAGNSSIPPNADLFFDVKLLDVLTPGQADIMTDDVQKGSGPVAAKGKKVTIKYQLTDLKDSELDTNTLTWTIGDGSVQPAVDLGVTGMKQGGIRVLRLGPKAAMPFSGPAAARGHLVRGIQHLRIELKSVQ